MNDLIIQMETQMNNLKDSPSISCQHIAGLFLQLLYQSCTSPNRYRQQHSLTPQYTSNCCKLYGNIFVYLVAAYSGVVV